MIQCWPPMPSAPDLGPAGQESIPARTGPLSPQPGSPVSVVHREWRLSAAVPAPGSELCSLTVTECCGIHKSVSATGGSPQKERSFRNEVLPGEIRLSLRVVRKAFQTLNGRLVWQSLFWWKAAPGFPVPHHHLSRHGKGPTMSSKAKTRASIHSFCVTLKLSPLEPDAGPHGC